MIKILSNISLSELQVTCIYIPIFDRITVCSSAQALRKPEARKSNLFLFIKCSAFFNSKANLKNQLRYFLLKC